MPPELLAYVDDRPVGWTRVGPRSDLRRLRDNGALAKCSRRTAACGGLPVLPSTTAILEAAVELARDNGATVVEGHPVDVGALRAARAGGSVVFSGTMGMFSAAGFVEVGRTYSSRPEMRVLL